MNVGGLLPWVRRVNHGARRNRSYRTDRREIGDPCKRVPHRRTMKSRRDAFRVSLVALLAGVRVQAAKPNLADHSVTFAAEGGVLYGSVDGYLQTPNGGGPGTTSPHRPTLHELGIDDAVLYEAGMKTQWRSLE